MARPIYISDPVGAPYRSKADHAFIVANMHQTILDRLAAHGLQGEKHEVAHSRPQAANLNGYGGLILLGGFDIDPLFYTEGYGHQRYPLGNTDVDAHQLDLIYEAVSRDLPVLGICRGHQLINVFFEGTLHYDIHHLAGLKHDNWGGATYGQRASVHDVQVSGSLALPTGAYATASSHHQAVDRLGKDLLITGYSSDGIVEMIEHKDRNIIGVQWHPESAHVAQSDTLTPLIRQFATRANTERDAPVQRPATAHTATHSRYFSDMVPEFEDEPDLYTLDGEPDYAADEEIPMWQVDYRTGEVTVRGRAEWVDVADYKDHDVWQNGNRGGFLIKQPATSLKPMF